MLLKSLFTVVSKVSLLAGDNRSIVKVNLVDLVLGFIINNVTVLIVSGCAPGPSTPGNRGNFKGCVFTAANTVLL